MTPRPNVVWLDADEEADETPEENEPAEVDIDDQGAIGGRRRPRDAGA